MTKRFVMFVAVAGTALAGCSSTAPSSPATGNPPAGSPAPTTSSVKVPYAGAPPVSTPLNVTPQQEAHPCKLLTAKDISTSGFEGVKPSEYKGQEGMRCDWIMSPNTLGIWWNTSGTGLSGTYDESNKSLLKQHAPVDGFPAITSIDETTDESCSVVVGLANNLSFAATATTTKHGGKVCAQVGTELAKRVIKNLKSGIGN